MHLYPLLVVVAVLPILALAQAPLASTGFVSAPCMPNMPEYAPNSTWINIAHMGYQRRFLVYEPQAVNQAPVGTKFPVLLMFHGCGGVYTTSRDRSWYIIWFEAQGIYNCWQPYYAEDTDYTINSINLMLQMYPKADRSRIMTTAFSSGGTFVKLFMISQTQIDIMAAASASGTDINQFTGDVRPDGKKIPYLTTYGMNETLSSGAPRITWAQVITWHRDMATKYGCSNGPTASEVVVTPKYSPSSAEARYLGFTGCPVEFWVYGVVGMGHAHPLWPAHDIDYYNITVDFFLRQMARQASAPVGAPRASPSAPPRAAPMFAPTAAPKASAPSVAPQAAVPRAAPLANPSAAPVASPKAAPIAPPRAAPASLQAPPVSSPSAAVPAAVPKAAPITVDSPPRASPNSPPIADVAPQSDIPPSQEASPKAAPATEIASPFVRAPLSNSPSSGSPKPPVSTEGPIAAPTGTPTATEPRGANNISSSWRTYVNGKGSFFAVTFTLLVLVFQLL